MDNYLWVVVLATSIWVLIDAKSIGVKKGQLRGVANMGPWGWFFGCLGLWVIGFPLYLANRPRLKSINRGVEEVSSNFTTPSPPSQDVPTYTKAHTNGGVFGSFLWLVVIVFFVLLFLGRGDGVVSPEIRVDYRQALMHNSSVMVLTNAGSKPLFNVFITSSELEYKYPIARQLDVGRSVEAGWVEIPGGVKSGVEYIITADGYPGGRRVTAP